MSSVSTAQGPGFPSPNARAHDRIAAQTAAGTISSADRTALDTAVDGIDASLKRSEAAGTSERTGLGPADLKARIGDLIGQQVQSGSLTRDQATTLTTILGGDADAGSSPAANAAASGDPKSSATDPSARSTHDLLATFVKQLQSQQDRTSLYGSAGARISPASASALLMNFKV